MQSIEVRPMISFPVAIERNRPVASLHAEEDEGLTETL